MLVVMLSGCLLVSDEEHAARLAQAWALFDTASQDSGAGDSAGTDSGETGASVDTGLTDDGSGQYAGTFTMTVDGLLGEDTCVGSATAEFDTAADPSIQGSATCSYGGVYDLHGAQSGTFEGTASADDATGAIEFGTGISVADIWSGNITPGPPPRLTATFSGTTPCDGTDCDYSGTFSMDRTD